VTIAAIPSPSTAVWHLGPVPIRAYALCIVLGIAVACVVTEIRLRRRGAPKYAVLDVAVWAVPFGIIGARIYHVITSPQDYFGANGQPLDALKIWEGGLGIWGAVAGGALGAWLGCRQLGIPLSVFADALAPGLPLGQAVGRVGNWFNNELYGGPTTLPWGLEIHQMDRNNPGQAVLGPDGVPELEPGLYHPTFLYEALWDVGVAVLVILLDRRYKFGKGRAFALYVMAYTAGRFWIELMRTDEANIILGARVNVWVSVLVFLGALIYFLRVRGPQEFLVPAEAAGGPEGGGYQVVTEDEYRTYVRTGALPATALAGVGVATAGRATGGDYGPDDGSADDGDDGADLVDSGRPALDDFADDETDETDGADEAEEAEEADDPAATDARSDGASATVAKDGTSPAAGRTVGSADER
jgi:prolipoprotein diacylglyceryl transferase